MSSAGLSRQVRLVLEKQADSLQLSELLVLVDQFVLECASSAEPEVLLFQLEDELQTVHNDTVDHASLYQTEVFLAVLYHLGAVLTSTSIISNWFDLVLRPALREPRLPTHAVNHAKELVISALQRLDVNYPEKIGDFRRRLLDLYLLDAFNEGSGEDVLEWAELNHAEREKCSRWKSSLEDILLKFGAGRPQDLLTEIHSHFSTPSSRLQLLTLLGSYTSLPSFPPSAAVLATHPLMSSLLFSLLLDNSSTVCTIGLTLLMKMLPVFAVQAVESLKLMLPPLLAILSRLICWKEMPPSNTLRDSAILSEDVPNDVELAKDLYIESTRTLHLRPDLSWVRLELTFDSAASCAPSPRSYFTFLYYLFPCNVLQFLRSPVAYLTAHSFASPYTVDWSEALDEAEIRSKSESLLRGHVCHPFVIWRDAEEELTKPDFWADYDLARLISECKMLDCRNAVLALQQHCSHPSQESDEDVVSDTVHVAFEASSAISSPSDINPTSGKPKISLSDMIRTSIALKSNLDVEIANPSPAWPVALFTPPTTSSSRRSSLPPESIPSSESDRVPSRVAEAISGLQRDVLLLRNELNFELWISRENVKHIGRLYQDRILSKNAEAERQGLYNKLRKYRAQVVGLERELREHKEQASSAKNKYADWNTELQKKLRSFREEKKSWISEAATLRTAEKEAQAQFSAQGKLLADAVKEVFTLQTQKKENQHKIDRLMDYERQIEQHIKMQRLWDEDFRKFNDRADEMQNLTTEYRKMEMRLASNEIALSRAEDDSRVYRRQIQSLEARLAAAKRKTSDASRRTTATELAAFSAQKTMMMTENKKLGDANIDLREEVEELRAMVELLKAQVSGRKGLVSSPRSSPLLLSPSLSPRLS